MVEDISCVEEMTHGMSFFLIRYISWRMKIVRLIAITGLLSKTTIEIMQGNRPIQHCTQ